MSVVGLVLSVKEHDVKTRLRQILIEAVSIAGNDEVSFERMQV